jgi:hypothetical protein
MLRTLNTCTNRIIVASIDQKMALKIGVRYRKDFRAASVFLWHHTLINLGHSSSFRRKETFSALLRIENSWCMGLVTEANPRRNMDKGFLTKTPFWDVTEKA